MRAEDYELHTDIKDRYQRYGNPYNSAIKTGCGFVSAPRSASLKTGLQCWPGGGCHNIKP